MSCRRRQGPDHSGRSGGGLVCFVRESGLCPVRYGRGGGGALRRLISSGRNHGNIGLEHGRSPTMQMRRLRF